MGEVDRLVELLAALRPGVVNVGHGRDPASARLALAAAEAWEARGGRVGAVVSWPAVAASWLRPAARLARDADAWLVADTPAGWAGLGPRLAATGPWDPARTVAAHSLADPDLPRAAGRAATECVHGHAQEGGRWEFRHGVLIRRPHSRGSVSRNRAPGAAVSST